MNKGSDSKLAKSGFLAVISLVELLERFAYYGLTSLLIIFLTSNLGFSDTKAYAMSSLFAAIGFTVPIVGGFLADKALGLRQLVVIGAVISILGYGCLSIFCESEKFIIFALSGVAVGTGIFKGNLTILLGSCYSSKEANKQDHGFTVFYTCINVGILVSAISCGYVAKNYNIKYGFTIASIGMVLSFLLFINYQHLLQTISKSPENLIKKIICLKPWIFALLALIALVVGSTYALHYSTETAEILGWSAAGLCLYYISVVIKSNAKERSRLLMLLLIIPFLTVFYGMQSQLYFAINLFTTRNLQTEIIGHLIPSTAFQAIAPSAAIVAGLFLSRILKQNKEKTDSSSSFLRFGIGLTGPFFCFVILYFGCCKAIDGKVSYLYLLSLCFIGAAEALIGPFAYNQATLLAPRHMKGYAMSLVLVSIAFGNLSTVLVSKFMSVTTLESLDCAKSLIIYKNGFLKLSIIQAAVCIFFFALYFLLNKQIKLLCKLNKLNQ